MLVTALCDPRHEAAGRRLHAGCNHLRYSDRSPHKASLQDAITISTIPRHCVPGWYEPSRWDEEAATPHPPSPIPRSRSREHAGMRHTTPCHRSRSRRAGHKGDKVPQSRLVPLGSQRNDRADPRILNSHSNVAQSGEATRRNRRAPKAWRRPTKDVPAGPSERSSNRRKETTRMARKHQADSAWDQASPAAKVNKAPMEKALKTMQCLIASGEAPIR